MLSPIEDISNYVYVNSSTGALYLLANFDREKVLSMRFTVFVRDRRRSSFVDTAAAAAVVPNTLTNQVQVTVEFIDINDSKPTCISHMTPSSNRNQGTQQQPQGNNSSSSTNNNDERNLIDAFAIRLDLDKLSSVLNPTSSAAATFELAKIYQFKCFDNDVNKNARLSYHIENVFLRDTTLTKSTTTTTASSSHIDSTTTTTTTTTTRRSLIHRRKPKRTRHEESDDTLNNNNNNNNRDVFQQQSLDSFLASYNLFALNSSTGSLYLNLKLDWSFVDSEFFRRLTSLVANKFVVLRVRVSDHGIVPLARDYFLRFYFCFYSESVDGLVGVGLLDDDAPERAYCDFRAAAPVHRNRTILVKHLSLSADDEEDNDNENEDEDSSDMLVLDEPSNDDQLVLASKGSISGNDNDERDDEDDDDRYGGGGGGGGAKSADEFRKRVNSKKSEYFDDDDDYSSRGVSHAAQNLSMLSCLLIIFISIVWVEFNHDS